MAKELLEIKIITPDRTVYDQTGVSEITIPTTSGEITVLPEHIPLISVIKTGEIRLKKDGVKIALAISGGILEIQKHSKLVILAERGELAQEIDLARAEEAYRRAKEAMEKKEVLDSESDFVRVRNLEKEFNRIAVAKKWR